MSLFRDTIFALSSGALPSGVAVVRLSGRHAAEAVERIAGSLPLNREAVLRRFVDGQGNTIDRGLLLFFASPRSFTGEDCAELHLHGGRAVIASMLATLAQIPGLRQAEAGEFTRRAFLNGKVDLTGAEALADLIAAETESQRRLAMQNAEGRQKVLYEGWAGRLLHARAMIEAELDFSDEGDIPGSVSKIVWADMRVLNEEIRSHIDGYRSSEIIRDGYRVVLAGPPNAGKSSLLNALAGRDVAIVTDVPGTTRDLLEVSLDLDGNKVIVTDTAGLRQTDDPVERIGVTRAEGAAARADLVLLLHDMSSPENTHEIDTRDVPLLRIGAKCDLPPYGKHTFDLAISAQEGTGMRELLQEILNRAIAAADSGGHAVPSRMRHVSLLREALTHLDEAIASPQLDLELRAEELRIAASALEQITGRSGVEDLLGVIFSEFCVGK